jgi:hypothetical protein
MVRRCNFSDILDGYFYWKKCIIAVLWNIYQNLCWELHIMKYKLINSGRSISHVITACLLDGRVFALCPGSCKSIIRPDIMAL